MKRSTKILSVVGTCLLGAGSAQAAFTTIGVSSGINEPTQSQIMSDFLGGTFTPVGENFTNGAVTATRVDDALDTTWTNAGNPVFISGTTALTDTVTYDAVQSKYVLSRNGGISFTSDPADNFDGKDHMITYEISGPVSGYMLFFEDTKLIDHDFDFNDVVLGTVHAVPLPMAFYSGMLCLGGLVMLGMKRRNALA
jgi:hypothetical protein